MLELILILRDILLPIFIIMTIGYFMQKKFQLNLDTLAKLNIYFLVPGFIFVKLYSASFSAALFFYIITFFVAYVVILFFIAKIVSKIRRFNHSKSTALANGVLFFNSGNYGVPVNDLVFKSDPLAMSVQVIVLTLQNIFTFTYGIFSLQSIKVGKWQAFLSYFRMPILYALTAALILNFYDIPLPNFIWVSTNYIADAMIAIALILLGAQVAKMNIKFDFSSTYLHILLRLVIGPCIALIIIKIMNLDGLIAQALFIASAMPSSINSSVIAQEYNTYPELAAQVVLFTTIFSLVTVTSIIYLSKVLF